jgi:hypothetical protein
MLSHASAEAPEVAATEVLLDSLLRSLQMHGRMAMKASKLLTYCHGPNATSPRPSQRGLTVELWPAEGDVVRFLSHGCGLIRVVWGGQRVEL